jgi:hypothetical protein
MQFASDHGELQSDFLHVSYLSREAVFPAEHLSGLAIRCPGQGVWQKAF